MSKTLILWVILILIIAGYASFFAISAIMPEVQSSELYLTQFNEWEDAGFGRNVAVKSWDYDEDDSAMAVIISYSGAANQTVQTEYMAMYRNKTINLTVLKLRRYIPRIHTMLLFSEISRVTLRKLRLVLHQRLRL